MIVSSPPVSTAAAINQPTSRWSESQVRSPPLSFVTPSISNLFDQILLILAPIVLRNVHSSCVCGSHAALYMVVFPGVLAAKRIQFSVPVTEGNHCRISVPLSQFSVVT